MEANETKMVNRKLDSTTTSMTLVELNDLVVSFRPMVKKAKVAVVHKLARQIETLRKKKGTEKQVASNNRKADNYRDEIEKVKKLSLDIIVKNSLANTTPMSDLGTKNNPEDRIILRIACHKVLTDKVVQWREKHEDWKQLAAFMLYKNTGRRYKKVKKVPLDNPSKSSNDAVESGEQSKESTSTSLSEKKQVQSKPEEPKFKVVNESDSEEEDESISSDEDSDDEDDSSTETELVTKSSVTKTDVASTSKANDESNKEMVVTKLDLSQLDESQDLPISSKDETDFLFEPSVSELAAKPKRDSFFLGGISDSGSEDSEESELDTEESSDEDGDDVSGPRAKDSVFVGSLMSGKGPKHKHVLKTALHKQKDRQFKGGRDKPLHNPSNMRKSSSGQGHKSTGKISLNRPIVPANRLISNQKETIKRPAPVPDAPVHPSWAASKKRKEQASIKAFSGKKRTFSDDDD